MPSAQDAPPSTTSVNSTMAPGARLASSVASLTSKGIVIASMKPGTFSIDAINVRAAGSVFSTMPTMA